MGGFFSSLGSFINNVGPTTASLLGESGVFSGGGITILPPAQAPAPLPPASTSQSGSGVFGEVLIVAVVAVAALLIYREMSKKK
jgi:hypothetical protein